MVDPGQPPFVRLVAHPLRWQLLTHLAAGDHRVRELVALVDQPQNLVSYHLRLLRDGGLVTATRSSFDGRDTYYHLDLDRCADGLSATGAALHPSLAGSTAPRNPRPVAVLFVCTGNSSRSPIAEALLRSRSGGHVRTASAGIRPKTRCHPQAERALRETFGLELTHRPQHLTAVADRRFDHVITLCDKAREELPALTARRTHWSVADPADGDYDRFCFTATDIDTRVRHLLPTLATEED